MIGTRIKALRTNRQMTQKELAEILGLTPKMISFYELGERYPPHDILAKLSNIFAVSSDYLLGISDTPAPPEQKSGAPNQKAKGIRIPVLGKVAAGVPIEAIEDEVDWEEIPSDWTRGGKEYFGLKVQGDSMYPKYLEDDTVIVRKAADCESGQDCVVYTNGYDATPKTVKKHEDGSLTLVPFNREYPPKTYSKEEIMELPVVICGVVVELRRKI